MEEETLAYFITHDSALFKNWPSSSDDVKHVHNQIMHAAEKECATLHDTYITVAEMTVCGGTSRIDCGRSIQLYQLRNYVCSHYSANCI